MPEYDALALGGFYSESYLKRSGHINNARSIGTIYDLVWTPGKSAKDPDVVSLNIGNRPAVDDSFVFRVVRHGENTQDIMVQDQNSPLVDRFLTHKLADVAIAEDIEFNDRTATLEPGHGFEESDMLEVNYNDGSVTPVIFETRPPAGVLWDINILSVNMLDQTAMDDEKFGGIPGPINGVVFRTVNDVMAENIFTAVDNSCFIRHCDTENPYSEKAPAGYYGFNAKRRFNGQQGDGVSRRIGGDYHSFQAIIAADVTGLDRFWMVVRGHVVENGIYND